MNIVVFDTETTSIEKPFCYNIGYLILDTETNEILAKHDFVVEQIWHNQELFTTAYYNNKRGIYINRMRGRKVIMEKFGYITQFMCREFKFYNVEYAFAYNSPFDDRVFEYNCEWFKVNNPFDNVPIYDIRGYVFKTIAFGEDYKQFCEREQLFTDSGNYSTTAESVYRFIKNDTTFNEEHTALADSEIECEILQYCIKRGCKWGKEYKVFHSIPREVQKILEIKDINGNRHLFEYNRIKDYKEKNNKKRIILTKNIDKLNKK